MTFSDKLQIAVLVVTIVAAIAALLQPSIKRINRVLATLVLVGVVVWLGITIISLTGETHVQTDSSGTSETVPPTTTVRTVTYKAPPEPTDTIATSGTISTAITTTTPPGPTITGTTSTHPQPKFEPTPPTPLPVTPQPLPVTPQPQPQPQPQPVPDPRAALEQNVKHAIALSESQQWREAANAWERLLRDHSGRNRAFDSGAWHRLGVAYEALNKWSKAATAFQQANLSDDRNNATSDLRHMGHCYIKLGRRSEAIDIYRKLLAIDPEDKTSRELLTALSR